MLSRKFATIGLACALAGGIFAPELSRAAEAPDDTLAPLVEVLKENDDPQFQLDILTGLSEALRGRRSVAMPSGWAQVEDKLAGSPSKEVRLLAQRLALTFGSEKALAGLRKVLQDAQADTAARRSALESLLAVKDPGLPPLLQALLSNPGLRAQALRGLALYDDPATPAAVLKLYQDLGTAEKRDGLITLSSRPVYARELLDAVKNGVVAKKDLTAELVRQLRNLKNPELDKQIAEVWGAVRETSQDRKAEIAKYKNIYRAGGSQPGDAMRGRAVFARTCQQCHTLFDVGGKVGPDLTGSNRADLDYILENMVDPNAVIPNDYRGTTIELKDDRVLTGIVKKEDGNAITLATPNELAVLPRNEIQSVRQSEISMMPEGLLEALNEQEVRDLIYYLSRPGQVPLIATKDTIGMFFDGKDLSGWDGAEDLWRVDNGEIVGSSKTGLKKNEFLKSQIMLKDFRLICKIKLTPNKENTGIQFRSVPLPDGEMRGYQADAGAGWWGKLYEEQGRALLWDKSGERFVKQDDWNTYEVLAVGHHIRTAINGNLSVDLEDPQGALQGVIGLQLHAGGPLEVRFKDFEIELDPQPALKTVK
jgi:putative heme-binding domain-containing protein